MQVTNHVQAPVSKAEIRALCNSLADGLDRLQAFVASEEGVVIQDQRQLLAIALGLSRALERNSTH